ncbi:MAG TPA: arginine repressor [Acidimicrobiales bacterium]|nr:arginine repressor [Acidimicrobiales bacterium]
MTNAGAPGREPIIGGGPLRLAKPQRQHRMARIIEQHAVSSQAQLVDLLAAEGVVATQATVSRDLEDLGAVKVRMAGGEAVYAIPEHAKDRVAPEEHLRRVLGEWVVEVAHSANLVVLRTPPGSAHVVGSALDRAGLADVLGTVAGDDTLIVVASERAGGEKVARRLSGFAFGSGASSASSEELRPPGKARRPPPIPMADELRSPASRQPKRPPSAAGAVGGQTPQGED